MTAPGFIKNMANIC